MAGISQGGFGADEFAGVARGKIVLAHVQAGLQQQGEVGAVVDYERRAVLAAELGYLACRGEEIAAPVAFVADLQDARAALQESRRSGLDGDSAAVERFRVDNRINARQFHGWGVDYACADGDAGFSGWLIGFDASAGFHRADQDVGVAAFQARHGPPRCRGRSDRRRTA